MSKIKFGTDGWRAIIAEDEIPTPVNPDPDPTAVTLKTRDTMYGGVRIGIAYQF